MIFEDMFSVYTLNGDYRDNNFTVTRNNQYKTEDQWFSMVKRVRHNLTESGIYVAEDKLNVIVSCSQLSGMEFNNEFDNSYFFKTYDEKPSLVPFSLLVRMRH